MSSHLPTRAAMPHLLTSTTWLRLIFQSWALTSTRASLEAASTELARLGSKKKTSIWAMNKAELVEVARKELGLTVTQAEKETVLILRERIRATRSAAEVAGDPLTKLPKGLDKMLVADLKTELVIRGLPEPEQPTRARMIMLIRDDVVSRYEDHYHETPHHTLTSTSSATRTPIPDDLDWNMAEDPMRRRVDRR